MFHVSCHSHEIDGGLVSQGKPLNVEAEGVTVNSLTYAGKALPHLAWWNGPLRSQFAPYILHTSMVQQTGGVPRWVECSFRLATVVEAAHEQRNVRRWLVLRNFRGKPLQKGDF